jgi:hypothetical protein
VLVEEVERGTGDSSAVETVQETGFDEDSVASKGFIEGGMAVWFRGADFESGWR